MVDVCSNVVYMGRGYQQQCNDNSSSEWFANMTAINARVKQYSANRECISEGNRTVVA